MIMMEPQFAFASRDEFWRLQEDIKAMYAKQTDHGERLARLERRQQDDSRQKNIWGPSSPFSGILGNSANEGMTLRFYYPVPPVSRILTTRLPK